MHDEPTLFDLEPAEHPPHASPSLEPFELPTTSTGRDPDQTPDLRFDTDLHLPKVGKCGNHDGRAHQALDALNAAGIGLEEIVDLVTRAVEGRRSTPRTSARFAGGSSRQRSR